MTVAELIEKLRRTRSQFRGSAPRASRILMSKELYELLRQFCLESSPEMGATERETAQQQQVIFEGLPVVAGAGEGFVFEVIV